MKNGNGIRYLKTILLGVILAFLFRMGQAYCLSVEHQKKQKEPEKTTETALVQAPETEQETQTLQADTGTVEGNTVFSEADRETDSSERQGKELESEQYANNEKTAGGSGIPGEEGGYPILDRYKDLYLENGDLAGWLSIEDMRIDYPVMQCEDDEYYLHHDFEGKDSKYGCLYVRERADLEEGTNFIIYGHNMKDGSMFGDLDFYREEDFYREHTKIAFDTLYKEYTYEIVAVFLSRIYEENDDAFKYYQFYEAETEEEFHDFYDNIKQMSLYDTGVEAEYGDTFLTLSTCAYHVNNGRLAVVAKRVK
ncbi:MAG: class B sortase [Lachnospiraceae bacterium]|nr:class B sortase [Lachnospiraceae bacterium]